MKISVIGAATGDNYVCAVDDLDEIESEFSKIFNPLPAELVTAIAAKYGTPQDRQTRKAAMDVRLAALDAAIAATDVDLALPTIANLAQFQAMAVEVNKLRNRQNAILRTLRYIYNHQ